MLWLSLADPSMDLNNSVARKNLLSNVFAGSRVASPFEMAIGYKDGISGLHQQKISAELVKV